MKKLLLMLCMATNAYISPMLLTKKIQNTPLPTTQQREIQLKNLDPKNSDEIEGICNLFNNREIAYMTGLNNLTPEDFKNDPEYCKRFIIAQTQNKTVCGAIVYSLNQERKDADIDHLAVHKDYRGKNIGKDLVSAVEYICLKNNIRQLEVSVFDDNKAAIQFYKRIGFKEDTESIFDEVMFYITSCLQNIMRRS